MTVCPDDSENTFRSNSQPSSEHLSSSISAWIAGLHPAWIHQDGLSEPDFLLSSDVLCQHIRVFCLKDVNLVVVLQSASSASQPVSS